ncbi:MAG: hypothetical protein K2N94_11345 [Lachnospiraceae bacterium]|nr:hypothetical protein [Lachnospiraceae bacterium]
MKQIMNVVTIILSILAFIISFMNYLNSRKKIISDIVSQDRIKWISDVRSLTSCFLEKYISGGDEKELRVIKSKIDLYIIYGKEVYASFENKLNHCILHPYNNKDYEDLVTETQIMLNGVWVRIKNEAGITRRGEQKIRKLLKRNS